MAGCSFIHLGLVAVLASGCGNKSDETDAGPSDPDCLMDAGDLFSSISTDVSDAVPTVVEVTWTTTEPNIGWVEFGVGGDLSMSTDADEVETTEHSFLLLGLLPSSEVSVRVMGTQNGASVCAADIAVETGPLDPALTEMTLAELDATQLAGGYTVIPLTSEDTGYVVILDEQGRAVWFYETQRGIFRARLSMDREAVVVNYQAGNQDNEGSIRRISLDGNEVTDLFVPGIHTDFIEIADERYASLAWTIEAVQDGDDERKFLGDLIIEIESDGQYAEVWNVFEHVDVDLDGEYLTGWYDEEGEVEEWSKLNGINYDAEEDAYYLTSRTLNAVLKVDRGSGDLLWTAANDWGDFELSSGQKAIFHPHSVEPIDGGLLVFNSEDECADQCSAAAELSMDFDAYEFEESWCYATEDCLVVSALGNAQRLSNGNTMLVLSTSGQIDETTSEGELVWRIYAEFGWEFGFAERVDALY